MKGYRYKVKYSPVIVKGETNKHKMSQKMKLVNNTSDSEKNLCFVNSALQLLSSVPRINMLFKAREYRLPHEHKRVMKICDEVARLFSSGGHFAVSSAELRRLVADKSGRTYLKDGSQQDLVEFLISLLQLVDEEISQENWEIKVVIQEFWGIEKTE